MKLTKVQIEALANKIKRKMQEKIQEERNIKTDSIKKTAEYKKLESFLDKRDELEDRAFKLTEAINKIANIRFKQSKDTTLSAYIDNKLPKSPKLETIIEDITIATIDKDFDAETFINNYINNHE